MPLVQSKYGRTGQSFKCIVSARCISFAMPKMNLTYFKDYPPCCASTFGYVYRTDVCGMGDDGEYFTLKADWGTIVVFGFKGLATGLS